MTDRPKRPWWAEPPPLDIWLAWPFENWRTVLGAPFVLLGMLLNAHRWFDGWRLERMRDVWARWKPSVLRWAPVLVGALCVGLGAFAAFLLARSLAVTLGFEAEWLGLPPKADRWAEIRNGLLIGTAALGAPFVIWRTWLANRQTEINQETHFTDLYAKAVEMLGRDKTVKRADGSEATEPNIEVRLGAIYALERIAAQSDRDYRPIIETLCAYVRQNVGEPQDPDEAGIEPAPEPPEDREETAEELAARIVAIRERGEKLSRWGRSIYEAAVQGKAGSVARPDVAAAVTVLMRRGDDRRKLEGWAAWNPASLEPSERPGRPKTR